MATRTLRTAARFFLTLAVLFFLCAPVWAQSADPEQVKELLSWMRNQSERDSRALEAIAAAQQQQAQDTRALRESMVGPAPRQTAQAQPTAPAPTPATLTHTLPVGQVGPDSYLTREEWNKFLAGDFANLKREVKSLKGRIAPAQPAAPRAPATSAPAPQSAWPLPAAERLLAVKFVGMEPNAADLVKVRDLVRGGRYDLVDMVWLPAPGATPRERGHLSTARVNALDQDYGKPGLPIRGRDPADSEERDQLVVGAPTGTGAVFYLKLKPPAKMATAPTAATPATP